MRQVENAFHWKATMTPVARQRRSPLGLFPDKPVSRLDDRMMKVLRVHHHSRRTEQAYIHGVRRYIPFHQHRHPRELAEDDVNRFLTSLAVKEHVAASTQNQGLSAILFLFDMRTVPEVLRHSDVKTTMIYTHVRNPGCVIRGWRFTSDGTSVVPGIGETPCIRKSDPRA